MKTINSKNTKYMSGKKTVIRGGPWYYPTESCRSSSRYFCAPVFWRNDIGIRLIIKEDEKEKLQKR